MPGRSHPRSASGWRTRRLRRPPPGIVLPAAPGVPSARSIHWSPVMPGLAAVQAERRHLAAVGDQRRLHRLEEADAADRAVAALVPALAARAAVDAVALEQHRVAPLQHLGVGQARVGHVGMHARGAVEVRARRRCRRRWSRNTGSVALPKVKLFMVPLRRGEHAEGAVERVGDPLRGLDIAGADRGRVAAADDRALGQDDVDRLQAALVHRDVVVDQRAEDVEHGGARHRGRAR